MQFVLYMIVKVLKSSSNVDGTVASCFLRKVDTCTQNQCCSISPSLTTCQKRMMLMFLRWVCKTLSVESNRSCKDIPLESCPDSICFKNNTHCIDRLCPTIMIVFVANYLVSSCIGRRLPVHDGWPFWRRSNRCHRLHPPSFI